MSRRIKILYTISNFDTAGSGKVVYDLIKGLDKSKFAPEVCCFHNKGTYFKTIKSLEVPIHLFEFASPYKPLYSLPIRVLKTVRFFKTNHFDLIHSWHWSSDFTEPLAAKLAGIPFVYTKKAMGWGNKSWRWRSQLSSKIIAINSDMMTQFFFKFKTKTIYLPLGVDTNFFKPIPKSYVTPEGLVFGTDDFVIVSVANLVPVKGIELLIEAVGLLNDPNLKIIIVGDCTTAYGQQLVEKYKTDKVHFVGKKLDVRPYLAVANLFVITTKDKGEGLPIAPLEAMASGRVVIGSNVSGVKDILENKKDLLFETDNVFELVSIIDKVLKMNKEEIDFLQKQMRLTTIHNFNIKSVVKKHENIYTSIVK